MIGKNLPLWLIPTFAASKLTYEPLPQDDPKQRQPDIALAKRELSWSPKIALRRMKLQPRRNAIFDLDAPNLNDPVAISTTQTSRLNVNNDLTMAHVQLPFLKNFKTEKLFGMGEASISPSRTGRLPPASTPPGGQLRLAT